MGQKIERLLSDNEKKRWWLAIGVTTAISVLQILFGIYVMEEYGMAMFVITPLFIGTSAVVVYGYGREITKRKSQRIAFATLIFLLAITMIFAIEGLICIVMALPILLFFTWIGSYLGLVLLNQLPDKSITILLVLIGLIPMMSFIEHGNSSEMTSVVTQIEIAASKESVWKNVVEFPELNKPSEFIFKTGIAYPINARIEGSGVGAVRHCNFTTGSFVEPITVWDEPNLLRFDVVEQPEPMKELSFYDIDAPHLHDYFVSKQGQFKLTTLPNGNTLLEGTTWYYHNIKPSMYWQWWSDYIIHKIHVRVLEHIKANSEIGS
jgi:hypothetical protein